MLVKKQYQALFYRIDRMRNVKMLKEYAEKDPDFNPAEYAVQVQQMFDDGKEAEDVVLIARNNRMINIIDRFGEQIETSIVDEEHFRATVNVVPSNTFFAWVFEFGGEIRVDGPERVRKAFGEMIRGLSDRPL